MAKLTTSIEVNGITHIARYSVEDDVIWLNSPFGAASTLLGGLPPNLMAKILLKEILSEKIIQT